MHDPEFHSILVVQNIFSIFPRLGRACEQVFTLEHSFSGAQASAGSTKTNQIKWDFYPKPTCL